MPLGRLLVALCLLAFVPAAPVATALAQDAAPTSVVPADPSQADLDGELEQGAVGAPAPAPIPVPGGAPLPDATGTTPAPLDAAPVTEESGVPAPPPYLMPGPDAAVQPVSGVANLTVPEVPAEPVRLAALLAAILAALALAIAAALRSLGVRTAATVAVETAPPSGPVSRVRVRTSALADDVRDFLRHSR